MLKLRADNQNVPVIETVATTGAGVEQLVAAVEARGRQGDVERRSRRNRRIQRLVAQFAARRIRDSVLGLSSEQASEVFALAREGSISIEEAADRALKWLARA
jgi:putative protein kinase ArgK-like GTPase of G3E family